MAREEYFTSLAKLGSRTRESFTPLLISRVYSVKTLKISTMGSLAKKPNIKISINIMREYKPLSLFYTLVYLFSPSDF
jgi:hypothetical protein